MKNLTSVSLLIFICLISCVPQDHSVENWKKEIIDTELAFAALVQQEGIAKGFLTYAAEDVVLMRNKKLIIGKDSLKLSFSKQDNTSAKVSLTWKPDFVDVSSSGDLGYTYGKYTYTKTDSVGKVIVDTGIFHTVWKRQSDGQWRFVWD